VDYHLYFHSDFDGVASGAVMLNFLKGRGDNIVSFTPVDYSPELKKKWANFRFKRPFIIVDFLYHPKASWWFDHHRTSFINKKWRLAFKNDKNHAFGPTEKSACNLMARRLKNEFGFRPPKLIAELIRWATLIDGALYKSAEEALEGKQPALKLARTMDPNFVGKALARYFEAIIKSLATKPIAKAILIPAVKKEIQRLEKNNAKVKKALDKISTVAAKVVFLDGTKAGVELSNYSGYYFYPKIDYTLTLEFYGNYYHLTVGKNPWKKIPARVHIGKMLNKYGGGGHETVGGAERKTKREILKIAEEIIEYLNRHG
jgi:hypothetical protein